MPVKVWLQRFLIVGLAYGAIFHAIQTFEFSKNLSKTGDDTIDRWDKRFSRLKEELPLKNGTVGYLADFDIKGIESNIADQEAEYILAQYAMAPIVLERNVEYDWIVGNLSPQAYEFWFASINEQYEVTNFGSNLYLIHRAGQ